jgi:hypothetical protein
MEYKEGERIEARRGSHGKWESATVLFDDGLCVDVEFEDGTSLELDYDNVRKIEVSARL